MATNQRLRGLVGQNMNGRKSFRDARMVHMGQVDASTGSGTVTTTRPCRAFIYGIGGGGSGNSGGGANAGGAGGGAFFKQINLGLGQTISYTVGGNGAAANLAAGNPGGNTTVTLPSGKVLTAGGGAGATLLGATPAAGGVATGGDINRSGGDGGFSAGTGSSATGGGSGGANGGGGGAAGFSDIGPGLAGGNGSAAGGPPSAAGTGAGGGASTAGGDSGPGGSGRVFIVLVRLS